MEYAFPWPVSPGEWLAWLSAAATVLVGIVHFFIPNLALRLRRLQTDPGHPEALAEVRGPMAGFFIGLGLTCILLAQPLIYFALGMAWGCTVFGRIVSILSDRASTVVNWLLLLAELVMCLLPFGFPFGFIT